jgi:hypothetical protein
MPGDDNDLGVQPETADSPTGALAFEMNGPCLAGRDNLILETTHD